MYSDLNVYDIIPARNYRHTTSTVYHITCTAYLLQPVHLHLHPGENTWPPHGPTYLEVTRRGVYMWREVPPGAPWSGPAHLGRSVTRSRRSPEEGRRCWLEGEEGSWQAGSGWLGGKTFLAICGKWSVTRTWSYQCSGSALAELLRAAHSYTGDLLPLSL